MRVEILEGMIRIVPQEEIRKRQATLKKPTLTPETPPVHVPAPLWRADMRARTENAEQAAVAQQALCTKILEVTCEQLGCDSAMVREKSRQAVCVKARRFVAYVARVYCVRKIKHNILAPTIGLGSKVAVIVGHKNFMQRFQRSAAMRAEFAELLLKLTHMGLARTSRSQ